MHYGYALEGKTSGNVKLGITRDVTRRIYSYATHASEPVKVRCIFAFTSFDEARKWERESLKSFAASRSHGEWILPCSELASALQSGGMGGKESIEAESQAKMLFARYASVKGKPIVLKQYGR